jgi:uncharacterized membrane protein
VLYAILEFLHVVAVILWIGPPLGAYYFLFRAHRSGDHAKVLWAERLAERVLWFEHLALLVLIASGVFMVQQSGWALLAVPWLKKKLALFAAVILFEAYDIWFAHRFMKRLLAVDVPEGDPRWTIAARLRRWLILGAIPVGALCIPMILWFAIAKQ